MKAKNNQKGIQLLIIRLLLIALLIWAASYLFIMSSISNEGPGILGAYQDLKAERDRLAAELKRAETDGTLEDRIRTRSRFMLFRLAYVPEESVKHADILVDELKASTKIPFEEKFLLFEEIANVYRTTDNFDKVVPIYTYLRTGIDRLGMDRKKVMLARLENNEAISQYLKGLSTPAPSVEMMNLRLKSIESAKDSIELTKKSVENSTIDDQTKEALKSRLKKNLDEINFELQFAQLSKKEYDEKAKSQK